MSSSTPRRYLLLNTNCNLFLRLVTLGATEYTYRGKIMTRGMRIETIKDGKGNDQSYN